MTNFNKPHVIVALDFSNPDDAINLVNQLDPSLCRLKVGKEMFTRSGPRLVEDFMSKGFDVFLDLKFHDIPNTVSKACLAAAELGVWMMNVHILGGRKMMEASREALEKMSGPRPLLIGVTVLTSLDDADLDELGFVGSAEDNVKRLAQLAKASGLDGIVSSPQEAESLRACCGDDFCLVTPGIRLAGAGTDDQKRIMTPEKAIAAGADYLVIGRPITQAGDPLQVLEQIAHDIGEKVAR